MKTQNQGGNMVIKLLSSILFMLIISISGLKAQSWYKLSNSGDNSVKVLGSSNVHDWTMTALNPVCEADFIAANGEVPKALKSFTFTVDAKSLKSEHSSMDDRTYKAIKADEYPKIVFKLTSATITPGAKDRFTITATGNLTIAGATKVITMQVNGELKPDNTITCSGAEKIKLTDFKITPPSFMLGAMKVKDDLTIQYTLNFKK